MTGAILAGGKSLRFGEDKSLYMLKNRHVIEWIASALYKCVEECLIVVDTPQHIDKYKSIVRGNLNGLYHLLPQGQGGTVNSVNGLKPIRIVSDIIRQRGPIGGIYTALFHASFDIAFIAACDMPFICPNFISYLTEYFSSSCSKEIKALIPYKGERLHPLHAIYKKTILKDIEDYVLNGGYSIKGFLSAIPHKKISIEKKIHTLEPFIRESLKPELSLLNINTKKDLEKAVKLYDKYQSLQ